MYPTPQTYPTAFLDNLQGYNLNAGTDKMLDLARMVVDSDSYYWTGVAFPRGATVADLAIAAGATFAGNVAIEPYSYIVNLSGVCIQAEGAAIGANGSFKVRVFEKGSKSDIINGQFLRNALGFSQMETVFLPGVTPQDIPFGPHWLQSPLIVLPPGSLQVEITNLEAVACYIQLLFSTATPVTDRSLNIVDIKG